MNIGNNIAIIPARGGSKRIPRKNCKTFCGKPILAYSIEAALKSGIFQEVMVSTDDNEIAELAMGYGAQVPFFRSPENSNDFAGTIDVIQEVLTGYQERKRHFSSICCIYPTAPFVSSEILAESHSILLKGYDSVFPVVAYSYPVQRALRFDADKIKMLDDRFYFHRSQDLEQIFHDAGQFYWLTPTAVFDKKRLFTDNSYGFKISDLDAQDIDTEMDWKLAELKFKLRFIEGA